MISWAPNSSGFVVVERENHAPNNSKYLRFVHARSGASQRICAADPQSAMIWNGESNSLLFTSRDVSDSSDVALYRLDLLSGQLIALVPCGENHLLSWNQEDNRIYFYQRSPGQKDPPHEGQVEEQRLFSCQGDGSDARLLGHFYVKETPCWSLSPRGNRMMFFHETDEPGIVDFTTGDTRQIRLH
jgi:hypothetical protein